MTDKSCKISIISDINGHPLNINCSAGNVNDSKILYNQLDDLQNSDIYFLNNDNAYIKLDDGTKGPIYKNSKVKKIKITEITT